MSWEVVMIEQDNALKFLCDNHADREVIFIRPCDEWIATYSESGELAGVTGINFKKNHMSVDCSYVKSDYRSREY